MRDALNAEVGRDVKDLDILRWTGRAALELLGQGALGYSFDPLVENVNDDFAEAVKSFLLVLGPACISGWRTDELLTALRRIACSSLGQSWDA